VIPGGNSGLIPVAVSAFYIPQNISPFTANFKFTPGPSIAAAHRPYIIIVPVKPAAIRAQAKGATWKPVREELLSGVRV
jgi:hypothetical protein